MPVTYSMDKNDKRHAGGNMPSNPKRPAPSAKKDSKGDDTANVGNKSSERDRMDYSGSC